MNNLYVSTTFIKDNQKIKIALDILKSAGIRNVELGSNHIYESNYNYIKKYNFNFLVHNYFPIPKENFVINIASILSIVSRLRSPRGGNRFKGWGNTRATILSFLSYQGVSSCTYSLRRSGNRST